MRGCPEILCHHCGQDYARDYWGHPAKADPCVCTSCRRDTNPDAADAPHWIPQPQESALARVAVVTPARKQCRMCRGEWDGLIFGPAPKGSPLPFGICPTCGAEEDRQLAAMAARTVPVGMPLLARPRRTADG